MNNKQAHFFTFFPLLLCFSEPVISAPEYNIHGLLDMRASITRTVEASYLDAGQGKFSQRNGEHLSLAQAGTELSVIWDNGLSTHVVINAYINDNTASNAFGLTEGYVKYRTLPSDAGYRLQVKAGIFYPEVSLENNAYAWASKNTLNSSMINTWIAEEIRVLGSEFKMTRLGKMNNNKFDLSLSTTAFVNNDPAGALIAWHGWTMSSRQTLWTETRQLPWFPARETGNSLAGQATASDPFLELDNEIGYHVRAEWLLHHKGKMSLGYYNNRATPFMVVNGQYGWHTRFAHLGVQWRLVNNVFLTAQYLQGKTLMQNDLQQDIVNNDYMSAFIALNYRWRQLIANNKHKSTLRVEHFSVSDNDTTVGDNNNEKGQAVTLNHTYQLTKQWSLGAEINIIDSYRPARAYEDQHIYLIESQLQLATRYFF